MSAQQGERSERDMQRSGHKRHVPQRRLVDALADDIDANARASGTAIVPSARDVDRRLDQVGLVVALAGGDVAGQREVRQAREMDVVGAADAALEHAAVPHRNAVRRAQIVQLDRLAVAADAAGLDVDDLAGPGVDRVARDAHGVDRLVEADRRRDPLLQLA